MVSITRFSKIVIFLLVVCLSDHGHTAIRRNPQTRAIDYTGVDKIATDCSPFIAAGYLCYDSDDDKLYLGDGSTANEVGAGGSSEWTDIGPVLHPGDSSGEESVAIGGTDATADIFLNRDGSITAVDASFTHIGRQTVGDATFTDLNVTGQITGQIGGTSSTDATFTDIEATRIGAITQGDASFTAIAVDSNTLYVDPATSSVHVGGTTGIDSFNVHGNVDIIHTSTVNDDHALELDVNAAGFGDVKAVDIAYTTGAISAGSDEAIVLINIDESAATGGDIIGLEVLATEGSATIYGTEFGVLVHPVIQQSGTFVDMDSALVNATDRLTEFTSTGSDIPMFVADNDTVTIGDAAQFTEIEFLLDTVASGAGIAPTFEFSTGVGTWTTFVPTDGTNGMRNSGVVAWEVSNIPTWAVGTGSEFLIRITRTRNSLSTVPIEDKVQIAATTIYKWDKDGNLDVLAVIATDATFTNIGRLTPGEATFTNIEVTGTIHDTQIGVYGATDGTFTAINVTGNADVGGNVAATGTVTGSNLSGTNTGDDDVPESGDFGNALALEADGSLTAQDVTFTTLVATTAIVNSKIGTYSAKDATFTDVTVSSLTASECVQTDANGILSSTGSACGAGGGELTDTGTYLHPADLSGVEDFGIGGTTPATATVLLDAGVGGIAATEATFTHIGATTVGDATFSDIQGTIGAVTANDGTFSTVITGGSFSGMSTIAAGLTVNNINGSGANDDFIAKGGSGNLIQADASADGLGFFNQTPAAQTGAYTITNDVEDRAYDANSTSVAELADALGTLIQDLQDYGLLQ